jgi:hypothetical protein
MGCIPSKPPPEPTAETTSTKPSKFTSTAAPAVVPQPQTPPNTTRHIPEVTVHEATPQQSRTSVEKKDKARPKDGESGTTAEAGTGGGAATGAAAVATSGGAGGEGGGGGGGGGGDGGGGGGGD